LYKNHIYPKCTKAIANNKKKAKRLTEKMGKGYEHVIPPKRNRNVNNEKIFNLMNQRDLNKI
jgi:hypothetical protein